MLVRFHCPDEDCGQRQTAHVDKDRPDDTFEHVKPFCEVHYAVMEMEVIV